MSSGLSPLYTKYGGAGICLTLQAFAHAVKDSSPSLESTWYLFSPPSASIQNQPFSEISVKLNLLSTPIHKYPCFPRVSDYLIYSTTWILSVPGGRGPASSYLGKDCSLLQFQFSPADTLERCNGLTSRNEEGKKMKKLDENTEGSRGLTPGQAGGTPSHQP